MSRQRDFFTQIGITKKDRNEMSGCMASMIVVPIYLIIDGIKTIGAIVIGIINIISNCIKKQDLKEKQLKIQENTVKQKIIGSKKYPSLKIKKTKEENDLILENDCFKLECGKLVSLNIYTFNYSIKWYNGSYFGGNFGTNQKCIITSKKFESNNYDEYFINAFELAKKEYTNYYKKEYNYFDKNPFKKRH